MYTEWHTAIAWNPKHVRPIDKQSLVHAPKRKYMASGGMTKDRHSIHQCLLNNCAVSPCSQCLKLYQGAHSEYT